MVQRMRTFALALLPCCRASRSRSRAAQPPAPSPIAPAAVRSGGRLHHRRAGRAGLSHLVSRRAVARGAGQGVQRLSDRRAGRRRSSRPGSCSAPRRRGSIAARQPFEIPPTEEWPHIVQTLRYVRDYVIPAVGPVEPVSAYRNPTLNVCAGGAPESAHKHYSAIDMVPLRPITREAMMRTLCAVHSPHGAAYQRRPRLLRLPALPRRQHQVPPLEHGPGGRRRMPADRPSRGRRVGRPAAAAGNDRRAVHRRLQSAPAPPPPAPAEPEPAVRTSLS